MDGLSSEAERMEVELKRVAESSVRALTPEARQRLRDKIFGLEPLEAEVIGSNGSSLLLKSTQTTPPTPDLVDNVDLANPSTWDIDL